MLRGRNPLFAFAILPPAGALLPAGVYFGRVSAQGQSRTRKMAIAR